MHQWLLSEKKVQEHTVIDETPGTARLLMKVMMKKLNEKYSSALNNEQRELIKAYAFSAASGDQGTIKKKLYEVKNDLLSSIKEYTEQNKENAYLLNKLNETKTNILSETLDVVDDSLVSKFMLYSKLKQELSEGDQK